MKQIYFKNYDTLQKIKIRQTNVFDEMLFYSLEPIIFAVRYRLDPKILT